MEKEFINYINFKISLLGKQLINPIQVDQNGSNTTFKEMYSYLQGGQGIIENTKEKNRLLSDRLNPVDKILQNFLNTYFKDIKNASALKIPQSTFVLDRPLMARTCSLPLGLEHFSNEYIQSYKIHQGVLHNPKSDRRTTEGSFHIVTGGPAVPFDKKEVPKEAFVQLFLRAFNPPQELMTLPYSMSPFFSPIETFVSLFLRPVVVPTIKGVSPKKTMATRFFAPAGLISNLDFIESIFGNAGDPELAENDPHLDIDHWSGQTGCLILCPHITQTKKVDLGLPHFDNATPRQRQDGMCYKNQDELYNDGKPFKLTCRDTSGVVITLIADNYFGYSKKEIKTQISFAANLHGLCEEEHAGGALVFPRRGLQGTFIGERFAKKFTGLMTFEQMRHKYQDFIDFKDSGYGIDKNYPDIIYIFDNTFIDIYKGVVQWTYQGVNQSLKVSPEHHYVYPSGHHMKMEMHPVDKTWQLVSTDPEGVFCHKPCTVSGGGKSEISKLLNNAINYGAFHVNDIQKDFKEVEKIINYDFKGRWKNDERRTRPARPLLSSDRSLGSVIKLLTPSTLYTDEYNDFLRKIPHQVKALVLFVKMFYRHDLHGHWQGHLSVDCINGHEGYDLLFNRRKITASFLRMGRGPDDSWYLHSLRPDFVPASKIQLEDDITASITVATKKLSNLQPDLYLKASSVKLVENCEERFFQRPDDAIYAGLDQEAERDLAQKNLFITNFEPLSQDQVKDIYESAIEYNKYTRFMQKNIKSFLKSDDSFAVISSHPRIVEGKPSKNPRYLQTRHNEATKKQEYLAEVGIRLARKMNFTDPIYYPVNAVLSSRRNNKAEPEKGIRPLSVYNPIHYQELPELFMDYICSLTGKSPSTTGAGSEGALTKGPFNMLSTTADLNNALLSNILCGHYGFTTVAGYVGHEVNFDHDISLLVPELWARLMKKGDVNPAKMIEEGSLEKLEDFQYKGKVIKASRLGYRITEGFLFRYFNRVFNEPQAVFSERILRPELQNMDYFVDGINNIVESHEKVAKGYFEDGSINHCIPPLKALLHIMAYGHYNDLDITHPQIRSLFSKENVLQGQWYQDRLKHKQKIDMRSLEKRINYIQQFVDIENNRSIILKLNLGQRLQKAKDQLQFVSSQSYLDSLQGTIGAEPQI